MCPDWDLGSQETSSQGWGCPDHAGGSSPIPGCVFGGAKLGKVFGFVLEVMVKEAGGRARRKDEPTPKPLWGHPNSPDPKSPVVLGLSEQRGKSALSKLIPALRRGWGGKGGTETPAEPHPCSGGPRKAAPAPGVLPPALNISIDGSNWHFQSENLGKGF